MAEEWAAPHRTEPSSKRARKYRNECYEKSAKSGPTALFPERSWARMISELRKAETL
jgi:hypothetical protein